MNNAATTAATTHLRATKLHGKHTVALEADIAYRYFITGRFLG